MRANDLQHGGDHYRTDYQHWDWSIDIGLPYLESAATKYLTRWEKKNGVIDIKKAGHYMEKAVEAFTEGRHSNTSFCSDAFAGGSDLLHAQATTMAFCDANELSPLERDAVIACASWSDKESGEYAISLIRHIQAAVEQGKHPRDVGYWPGPRQARLARSTTAPVAPPGAGQGTGLAPPWPERSTKYSSALGHPSPFGYDGDG